MEGEAGLAQERHDGVVATDRLQPDDPESGSLTKGRQFSEQDRLSDPSQACQLKMLARSPDENASELHVGVAENIVAPDQLGRWRSGSRRIGVGHRVIEFCGHAAGLAELVKLAALR